MKKPAKKIVAVAMSGGVDSSVAAALLKKQGYEVIGVFMQFWHPSPATSCRMEAGYNEAKYGENRCCSLESWQEAQEVARILDLPIYKVNFGREFKKRIVDEFIADFARLKTPNPCVACNKSIKFDLLLKYVRTVFGADYLATGHYVRLRRQFQISNLACRQAGFKFQKNTSKKSQLEYIELWRAEDRNKDQTYFLYNLKQDQLKHLFFPLADYTKPQIRALAKKFKFAIHDKADSQEICFVGRSHVDFLKKYLKPKGGMIVDLSGKILGRHQGLALYTLGQRNGLGLSGGPWYVIGFKKKENQLIVSREFSAPQIQNKIVKFKSANWLSGSVNLPLKCSAQIRYRAPAEDCVVRKTGSRYQAEFVRPQRAAMPGQSIVFYDGDQLLGGGIIL